MFLRGSAIDAARVEAAVERLEELAAGLRGRDESVFRWRVDRRADIRYFGQISGYLTLPLSDGDPVAALREAVELFGREHRREFGYQLPASVAEAEIVNLRTALMGEVARPPEPVFAPDTSRASATTGRAWFAGAGWLETDYLQREGLRAGARVEGPAVIAEWAATTVVPPGLSAAVEPTGDLVMRTA
jgi:N-methylhydantoinase A